MDLNFEESLAKLEAIIEKLESSELSLDKALDTFEEGMQLSRLCSQKLEQAELRVQQLIAAGDDDFESEPFDIPDTE